MKTILFMRNCMSSIGAFKRSADQRGRLNDKDIEREVKDVVVPMGRREGYHFSSLAWNREWMILTMHTIAFSQGIHWACLCNWVQRCRFRQCSQRCDVKSHLYSGPHFNILRSSFWMSVWSVLFCRVGCFYMQRFIIIISIETGLRRRCLHSKMSFNEKDKLSISYWEKPTVL